MITEKYEVDALKDAYEAAKLARVDPDRQTLAAWEIYEAAEDSCSPEANALGNKYMKLRATSIALGEACEEAEKNYYLALDEYEEYLAAQGVLFEVGK